MSSARELHRTVSAVGVLDEPVNCGPNGEFVYKLIAFTATAIDVQPQIFIDDVWIDHGTSLTTVGGGTVRVPAGAVMRLNITGTGVTSAELAAHG